MSSLSDYTCPICLEPSNTAVSLVPCGHELHEQCAIGLLQMGNEKCPTCRTVINNGVSYLPAFSTRNAVQKLLSIEEEPKKSTAIDKTRVSVESNNVGNSNSNVVNISNSNQVNRQIEVVVQTVFFGIKRYEISSDEKISVLLSKIQANCFGCKAKLILNKTALDVNKKLGDYLTDNINSIKLCFNAN